MSRVSKQIKKPKVVIDRAGVGSVDTVELVRSDAGRRAIAKVARLAILKQLRVNKPFPASLETELVKTSSRKESATPSRKYR